MRAPHDHHPGSQDAPCNLRVDRHAAQYVHHIHTARPLSDSPYCRSNLSSTAKPDASSSRLRHTHMEYVQVRPGLMFPYVYILPGVDGSLELAENGLQVVQIALQEGTRDLTHLACICMYR